MSAELKMQGNEEQGQTDRADVVIGTIDLRRLVGSIFGNPATAKAAIALHPATAVPSSYYTAFAKWLAQTHDVLVLTYDYRDFGASAKRSMRESDARMSDWGILDQGAALSFLVTRYPHLPVRVIGHSVGAQFLAFHDNIDKVDRVAAVCAGPAYWLDHPRSYMPTILMFWWLVGPVVTRVMGYMPGKKLGLGSNIPAGVYWQWRRWCLTRQFSRVDWGGNIPSPDLSKARFNLTLLPVADDVMIPPLMVRRLADFYPAADISEDLLTPADFSLREIGHLRAFAPRNKAVWPRIAAAVID
jgi:predicted alpha/beta hydrolase